MEHQNTLRAGDKIKLDGILYSNSQTHCGMRRSGEWFIYDGKLVNGRYRVTNLESRIGKYPISGNRRTRYQMNHVRHAYPEQNDRRSQADERQPAMLERSSSR